MELWVLVLLLLGGFYAAWTIGANDAGNCIGTAVGSGLLEYRQAVWLVASFAVLGAVLQGHKVMETMGKGLITTSLSPLAILVVIFSSAIFVTLATFYRLPVSTSQAIVGGVVGIGVANFGFDTSGQIAWGKLLEILECWVLNPILALILSALIYLIMRAILRRTRNTALWEKIIGFLVIASACYVGFSLGANNVGNAIGPIVNIFHQHLAWLTVFGGVAIAIGVITYSKKVTETVGRGITPLDLLGAFSAQISAGFGIHLFTLLGIPISTSQAIVGAVAGVGIVRGIRTVSMKTLTTIFIGWVTVPVGAAVFSGLVYKLLSSFI